MKTCIQALLFVFLLACQQVPTRSPYGYLKHAEGGTYFIQMQDGRRLGCLHVKGDDRWVEDEFVIVALQGGRSWYGMESVATSRFVMMDCVRMDQ